MATNIGKLSVLLSANTTKFGRDMKGAQKRVSGLSSGVKKLAIGLAGQQAAQVVSI